MNVFESRYFDLNRKLMLSLGIWPYGSKNELFFRSFFIGTMMLSSVPQLLSIILHYQDMDRLMLSTLFFLAIWTMILKMVGIILAEDEMKELHDDIANNWKTIDDQTERNILHKYSERGRKLTIFYAILMAVAGATINLFPFVPKILDQAIPLENPRPNLHITGGVYFVDRATDKNFALLFIFDSITVILMPAVSAIVDTMFMASTEHCCALYAIVGHRLLNLSRRLSNDTADDDDSYECLVQTIRLHQRALNFTSMLNKSYSKSFLFLLSATLFIIPLSACAIIANLHDPLHLMPYVVILSGISIHDFFLFWPGQRVLDHGIELCDDACYNEWYTLSLRSRKLLLILMQRCSKPATITAGGLIVMNYESFTRIMRTCISYITVAASFR